MEIIAEYSFNGRKEFIEEYHKAELKDIISSVDALLFNSKAGRRRIL